MEQVIALGGGGFSDEPENPLLDLYILSQSRKEKPKVCFLPTASGDAESYLLKFYESFSRHQCEPSHLSLFQPHTAEIGSFLLSQGVIDDPADQRWINEGIKDYENLYYDPKVCK